MHAMHGRMDALLKTDRLDDLEAAFIDMRQMHRKKTKSVSLETRHETPSVFDTFSFMHCLMIATDASAALSESIAPIEQREAHFKSFLEAIATSIALHLPNQDTYKAISDRFLNDQAIAVLTNIIFASILVRNPDDKLRVFPNDANEEDSCIGIQGDANGFTFVDQSTLHNVRKTMLSTMPSTALDMRKLAKMNKPKLAEIATDLGIPLQERQFADSSKTKSKVKPRVKDDIIALLAKLAVQPTSVARIVSSR